jgi:hypothetical protein
MPLRSSVQSAKFELTEMRYIIIVAGVILAAIGGVVAYRALFLEPTAAVLITSSGEVRDLPNYARIIGGSLLLVAGAVLAFVAATRKL